MEFKENYNYNVEEVKQIKDKNGKRPGKIMIETDRGSGKTTGFNIEALKLFKNNGYETCYVFRDKSETEVVPHLFGDIFDMYPEYRGKITMKNIAKGMITHTHIDGKPFAYGVSLKDIDKLKKISPIFRNVQLMIFDEFQLEKGNYIRSPKGEANDLEALHMSINRGGGLRDRGVKMYMLGNHVDLLNPHYVYHSVHQRYRFGETKVLRGDGWIAQFQFGNESSKEIENSAMFRANRDSILDGGYGNFAVGKGHLYESNIFIGKPTGRSKYICTLIHNGVSYGIREYYEDGMVYVTRSLYEPSCKTIITFKAKDHRSNTLMANHYSYIYKFLKECYYQGWLWFEDDVSKISILDILAVDMYR